MKRNKKSPYFNSVSSVIDGLIKDIRIEKGLRISSLTQFWPKIVGPRFEKTSNIFSVNDHNGGDSVTVAVSSSSVAQDLNFYKRDILKKLQKVGEKFGFDIKEVTFSTKHWKEEKKEFKKQIKNPTGTDIENIEIPEEIIDSIKDSLEEIDEELREKFLNTVIKDLKRQIWLKENNYPICAKCKIPLAVENYTKNKLCPSCNSLKH